MAKIAAAVEHAVDLRRHRGDPGGPTPRVIARGQGWRVADVVCTAGPADRPYGETHSLATIAVVVAGTFSYRTAAGRSLMTPGSLLLGNQGQAFECGHEHGEGDRCVSFSYAPELLERLAAEAGGRAGPRVFTVGRVPPVRALAPLVARASGGVLAPGALSWEELAIALAGRVVQLAGEPARVHAPPPGAEARVTRVVRAVDRAIEDDPARALTLARLAREAGLSPYHFLRTFTRVTGVTPHQYILRARLRHAAARLLGGPSARILDVALEAGFGDVSNFNRAFRAEFGVSPRVYRQLRRRDPYSPADASSTASGAHLTPFTLPGRPSGDGSQLDERGL